MNCPTCLTERLCRSLAFHLVESELTLQHAEGDLSDWREEIEIAKALIKEAGFDIDVLYPVEDRPTSTGTELQ
jgi:hypothetical protein